MNEEGYDPYNTSTRLKVLSVEFTPNVHALRQERAQRIASLRIQALTACQQGKWQLAAELRSQAEDLAK